MRRGAIGNHGSNVCPPLIGALDIWNMLTRLSRLDYSEVSNSRTKVLRQGKDSEKASLSSASKSTSVDMISLVENVVRASSLVINTANPPWVTRLVMGRRIKK
jgi:hypothetical protein